LLTNPRWSIKIAAIIENDSHLKLGGPLMFASLLLMFREGLEAALIVGIMLGYLGQVGHQDRRRTVWIAVAAAAGVCVALAVGLQIVGASLEGRAEPVFEGLAMLLAVVVLTWMIFWMRYQARHIKSALEAEIRAAVRQEHGWALFSLAFLAVFREGVEMALFVTAIDTVTNAFTAWVGGLIGLAAAAVVGWLIYTSTARLNVRRFFDVTSVILLMFAAGLFAHSIYELQEAGWLPVVIEHVWNLKPLLDDSSTIGSLLRVLVGYNDDPALLEVIGYLGYWVVVAVTVNRWANRRVVADSAAARV
jgi:high-affinity iron transporter